VATTLSYLVYELCARPEVQARLRDEIDAVNPEKPHLDVSDLAECEYLNGVIHETLRLHPAVPSGPARETPPEGLTLPDGTYIPGNVIIWTPIYTLQRDPRYWEKPLSFMPERWTSENPDAIIDKRTFLPFLTGAYNCIGQKLAVMEIRSVAANLVRSFEITFAEGEDGSTIEHKSRDCFTLNVGKLDVKLTPRQKL
jgi:cytochrome P450